MTLCYLNNGAQCHCQPSEGKLCVYDDRRPIYWQPIETAPKDGTSILLTDARVIGWTQVAAWEEDRNSPWAWGRDDCDIYWHADMFTHWMPLPEPPPYSPQEIKND